MTSKDQALLPLKGAIAQTQQEFGIVTRQPAHDLLARAKGIVTRLEQGDWGDQDEITQARQLCLRARAYARVDLALAEAALLDLTSIIAVLHGARREQYLRFHPREVAVRDAYLSKQYESALQLAHDLCAEIEAADEPADAVAAA